MVYRMPACLLQATDLTAGKSVLGSNMQQCISITQLNKCCRLPGYLRGCLGSWLLVCGGCSCWAGRLAGHRLP